MTAPSPLLRPRILHYELEEVLVTSVVLQMAIDESADRFASRHKDKIAGGCGQGGGGSEAVLDRKGNGSQAACCLKVCAVRCLDNHDMLEISSDFEPPPPSTIEFTVW